MAETRLKVAIVAVLGLAACETPAEVVGEAMTALSAGRVEAVAERVHPDYSDTRGDRAVLQAELAALAESGPIAVRLSDVETVRGPAGPTVIGKVEVQLSAAPTWTFTGPLGIELSDRRLIRSGLLDDLRELRALFDARRAALEANDAAALGALLHPEYRDGTLDRGGAIERLGRDLAGTPIRVQPLSYWAEVRGLDAHVDERYTLTLGERSHAAIARFTLRRAAGRWRIHAGLYPAGTD